MTELEQISRALCEASGFNPDDFVRIGVPAMGSHGHEVVRTNTVAQWRLYEDYVRGTLSILLDRYTADELEEAIKGIVSNTAEAPELLADDQLGDPRPDWRQRYGLNWT